VPFAIVIMPLPAPYNSANAMIPGAPSATRNAAPIGCSTDAIRADATGWNERNRPNSTIRAPTQSRRGDCRGRGRTSGLQQAG
jgi:hypothetical protein